jgi:hypothetical protein
MGKNASVVQRGLRSRIALESSTGNRSGRPPWPEASPQIISVEQVQVTNRPQKTIKRSLQGNIHRCLRRDKRRFSK